MNESNLGKRSYLVFMAITLLLSAAAQASPPSPPEFEEGWYVATMQSPLSKDYQPCGYMHGILKRVGQEMHSEMTTRFEIKRGDSTVSITMEQTYRETLEGKPLSFSSTQSLATVPSTTTGVIEGDKVKITEEQFGAKKTTTYPFDPEVKFAWGQLLAQREHGLKPGTTFTLKTYEPSLLKNAALAVKFTVHGREAVEVLGKKQELHHLTSSMKMGPAPKQGEETSSGEGGGMTIDSEMWVDENMTPIVMSMNFAMFKVRMYKTTKENALKGGAPPEMFLDTMVHVKDRIGMGAKSVKLRLKIKGDEKTKLPTLPNTAMQTFERKNAREAVVTIRRLNWEKIRKVRENAKKESPGGEDGEKKDSREGNSEEKPKPKSKRDKDLAPYLAASTMCDSKDSQIRRLARKAVKGLETPAKKADALRKFVTDYITDKNMDVGFATATEVVRKRSGDCSEHAVLLAALARAVGLPSRGVCGIVEVPEGAFMPEEGSAFGYHMWTEVYIGNQWVDIDAALRQTDVEPNHLAVTLLPLGDEGLMDSVVSLVPLLGQLEIEVLEVKR
jgi:hypothetical protein